MKPGAYRIWPAVVFGAALGLSTPVAAKGVGIHYPKNLYVDQFQQNCTDMGGTTDSGEKNHSKCTLPSGTSVDCANDDRGQIEVCTSSRKISRRDAALFGAGATINSDTLAP